MEKFIERPSKVLGRRKDKLLYGIGVFDVDYAASYKSEITGKVIRCPYYVKWVSMFTRCYSTRQQRLQPTYQGCSVSPDWHHFSDFKSWMQQQSWEGKELDKDVLVRGNKVYGPSSCIFITRDLNMLLHKKSKDRGNGVSDGVYYHKSKNEYRPQLSIEGKNKILGYCKSDKEAAVIYNTAKAKLIMKNAEDVNAGSDYSEYDKVRLVASLTSYAEELINKTT